MRRSRIRTVLLVGLPALGAVAVLVYALMPRPVPVDVARAVRGTMRVTVDEDGKTRIRERYIVSTPLAGRLGRVTLKAGDPVVAGETVLAGIEPVDPGLLDARSIAQAEARVKAAEATRQQAVPNLDKAKVAHRFARSELTRVGQLFESRSAGRQELDDAELKERVTAEELKAATFALQVAEFELEQARAALLYATGGDASGNTHDNGASPVPGDAAQRALPFAVRSPVSGRVLRVMQESSAVVSAGTPLLEVGDPADLEVEVDVLSRDATRIRPSATVLLDEWGGPRPLTGRVRVVEPAAFLKISALGVEEQRVWVIIDLIDPPAERATLGDRYRVEARIVVWEGVNVLRIPAGAAFRHGDGWAAYRVEGGRARLTPVVLGHRNASEVEIVEGLREGDVVLAYPSDRVRDGTAVSHPPAKDSP